MNEATLMNLIARKLGVTDPAILEAAQEALQTKMAESEYSHE